MKTFRSIPFCGLAVLLLWGWRGGAAEFRNLDFEEARIVPERMRPIFGSPSPPTVGVGQTADLIPGWSLYAGRSFILSELQLNFGGSLSREYYAALVDRDYRGSYVIEGQYSMYFDIFSSEGSYRLAQTGVIPAEATHLIYRFDGNNFRVEINGEPIHEGIPGQRLDMVDINRFAGQEVELAFVTQPHVFPVGGGGSQVSLDSIAFAAIPEPSTYALLALGAGLLGGRWLWRHRHRRPSPRS